MIFTLTNNNTKLLGIYRKLCSETKNQIVTINGGESNKYKKDFMIIRFDSYDDLPLGKVFSIATLGIVVQCVFQNESKYYPQIHTHECGYERVYEL